MTRLTPRQQEILTLIQQHIERCGAPPSRHEIAEAMGFRSVTAAKDHLLALQKKGYIEISPGKSRGIRLLQALPAHGDSLPLVGRVAAGQPILAQEHIEDYIHFDPGAFRPRADYLLRVQGMSMRDAGILDGDLLAVHATPVAENGQIVVARLQDEVTVKRLKLDGHLAQLLPENPDFAPIVVDLRENNLEIEGIGAGIIRKHLQPS
ncbi:MAG: hypothetical protein DSZ33_05865 [Gammaproteobacteria bacterium]|nr:MAG: hypothetical protein DSZ33_05865 [Gammaproteobacteria bacterium]